LAVDQERAVRGQRRVPLSHWMRRSRGQSSEAIFLSTFILISQNHETQLSERRNKLDLQINLLTEQENTKLLRMLERIAEKVDAKTVEDPSIQVLDQATHPEKLVEQIEKAAKPTNPK
jgi:uncharacterized membrane protein